MCRWRSQATDPSPNTPETLPLVLRVGYVAVVSGSWSLTRFPLQQAVDGTLTTKVFEVSTSSPEQQDTEVLRAQLANMEAQLAESRQQLKELKSDAGEVPELLHNLSEQGS